MPLRSLRERAFQTLLYEAIGLVLIAPLCAALSGGPLLDSGMLLAVLAVIVMLWAAVYNTAFDMLEHRLSTRVASDRRRCWRIVHAILLETSACIATLPVTMAMTGMPIWEAFRLEFWLTVIYAAYAFFFHAVFDRLRPVVPISDVPSCRTSRPEAAW